MVNIHNHVNTINNKENRHSSTSKHEEKKMSANNNNDKPLQVFILPLNYIRQSVLPSTVWIPCVIRTYPISFHQLLPCNDRKKKKTKYKKNTPQAHSKFLLCLKTNKILLENFHARKNKILKNRISTLTVHIFLCDVILSRFDLVVKMK